MREADGGGLSVAGTQCNRTPHWAWLSKHPRYTHRRGFERHRLISSAMRLDNGDFVGNSQYLDLMPKGPN